jgi:hypothetical protein
MNKTEAKKRARQLTSAAIATALDSIPRTLPELARERGLPVSTVTSWFQSLSLTLATLCQISDLSGVSPAALLLSDRERQLLQECADSLESDYHTMQAEDLRRSMSCEK